MTEYNIAFDAWTTIEAENVRDAIRIAKIIINACTEASLLIEELGGLDVTLEMVVRDSGIEEA